VITITVEPIAILSAGPNGGTVQLEVAPDGSITTASRELRWTVNIPQWRVTVQTNLPSEEQHSALAVRPVQGGLGTRAKLAPSWVQVGLAPATIVTGVGISEGGGCLLEYRAEPIVERQGSDCHTLTYTITDG